MAKFRKILEYKINQNWQKKSWFLLQNQITQRLIYGIAAYTYVFSYEETIQPSAWHRYLILSVPQLDYS